jgi:hypothetical protein
MYRIYLQAAGLGTGTPSMRDVRVGYKNREAGPRRIAQHVAEWLVSGDETTTPMSCCSAAAGSTRRRLRAPFHGHRPRRGSRTAIAALLSSSLRRPQLSECFSVGSKMCGENIRDKLLVAANGALLP